MRLGPKQARTLLQLSAGYVVCSTKDPYKALRAKGLVEDSATYEMEGVVFERKGGKKWPTVTRAGHQALREFVDRDGRLEIELSAPFAPYSTVIRMDPRTPAASGKDRP